MYIGKRQAGSIDKYRWAEDGAVIEVPERLGLQLVGIAHADFFEVPRNKVPVKADPLTTEEPEKIDTGQAAANLKEALQAATTTRPTRTPRPKA